MKVVVAGYGHFGSIITDLMLSQGHDVVVVDSSESKTEEVNNARDVLAVCGNCADYDLLTEIGMMDTDVFVACTVSDEINLLASTMSKAMGAKNTIARALTDLSKSKAADFAHEKLGIDLLVSPDYLTAQSIYKILDEHRVKKVMILGASKVGIQLTQILLDKDLEVQVIDRDASRCEELSNATSGGALILNSNESNHQVLEEAGIRQVDAVVTATPMDEVNTILSLYAMECKAPLVITKIWNSSYIGIIHDLNLDHVVTPRTSVANIVLDYINNL